MNRYYKLIARVFLVGVISLAGCKKDDQPVNFHYGYFPQSEGRFVVYAVHEENIDLEASASSNYSIDYYLKTLIGDTLIDNEGRVVRRFERYLGQSATGPWTLKDIWTSVLTADKAELVEENNRVIKLVFAPTKYKEWNANAFNILDPLDCYYTNIHKDYSLNGFDFDSTITVEQQDEFNFVWYKRKFEVYAKNVGMIYKHFKDFEIDNYDSTQVSKGYTLIMKAVDFGIE